MPKNKSGYFKRVNHFYDRLFITPAPNRLLIRITKQQIEDLISKVITRDDGTKAKLFFEPMRFDEGFERRFQQNVSVGEVIGVGADVMGIQVGDTAILDYLVSNITEDTIGYLNGDQLISIIAATTYHENDAIVVNGRRAWVKGDFDYISRIYGIVREDKLIPFDPYIFLEYKSDVMKILNPRGESVRENTQVIHRNVIAVPEGCGYDCGDRVFMKKDDWFDREIGGHAIAICFRQDILCKANACKILSE